MQEEPLSAIDASVWHRNVSNPQVKLVRKENVRYSPGSLPDEPSRPHRTTENVTLRMATVGAKRIHRRIGRQTKAGIRPQVSQTCSSRPIVRDKRVMRIVARFAFQDREHVHRPKTFVSDFGSRSENLSPRHRSDSRTPQDGTKRHGCHHGRRATGHLNPAPTSIRR